YREALDAVADGTYNREKVAGWMERLKTVYNRGFWSGYYLGQKLGEWTPTPGSIATQKKIYIGKNTKYFSKIEVAEFLIESHDLKVGDTVLIQGPTTGSQELVVEAMVVENKEGASQAEKADVVAF